MAADIIENFVYDYNGRIIRKSATVKDYDGGTVHYTSYAYDLSGNLRQVVYEDEAKQAPFAVKYQINRLGQVVSVADGDGELAAYAYKADGSLMEETFRPAAGAALVRHYRYDSRGSLTEISDPYFQETLTYTENGFSGYISYIGRIVSTGCRFSGLKDGKPENFVPEYQYQYAYDRLGRLITARHDRNSQWSYGIGRPVGYDADGNSRRRERGGREEEFSYQPGTNKLDRTDSEIKGYRYDAAGNVTGAPARRITWIDYDLRSRQAVLMAVNDGQDTLTFGYDGSGRRTLQQGKAGKKLYILSKKGLPLLEKTAGSQAESVYCIYGPTGLLAVKKQGRTYFLFKDHSGSTRAVYDGQGICAAYSYDPFGNFLGEVFEPQDRVTDYLYTGQELDSESGLYNYKARLYDSYLGRFYSADPAGQFASPYIYAGGDPVNFIDPSGLWSWSEGGVVSVVLGGLAIGVAIALSIATGGAATPGIAAAIGGAGAAGAGSGTAAAATAAGLFLSGAGISSVSYGITTMAADQQFNWGEWGISSLAGGAVAIAAAGTSAAVAARTAGLGQILQSSASLSAGGVTGAAVQVGTQAAINTYYDRDATERLASAAIQGAITGILVGFTMLKRARVEDIIFPKERTVSRTDTVARLFEEEGELLVDPNRSLSLQGRSIPQSRVEEFYVGRESSIDAFAIHQNRYAGDMPRPERWCCLI